MAEEASRKSGGSDEAVAGMTPPGHAGQPTITGQSSGDHAETMRPETRVPTGTGVPVTRNPSGHVISRTGSGRPGSEQSQNPNAPPSSLLNQGLLRGAPRVVYNNETCPALGGIPMLKKLGQGGMGAVFYGVHPRLHIEVAVKVLPYDLVEKDPTTVERFFREAQIAAMVRSPHLVHVMDVNEEGGLFFSVMEYVNGMSAMDHLEEVRKTGVPGCTEQDTLLICMAATTGLIDAHNAGVIHRDIKPQNIMIPWQDAQKKEKLNFSAAKLMDLGLARNEATAGGSATNQGLTGQNQAMGTPGYMAPEQIEDAKHATKRSDVFSMGATLYAMLAGQAPFHRKNPMQTLMATINDPHPPLSEFRTDLSEPLTLIIDKCLAKSPDDRYADAGALLADLKKFLAGGKVEGPPPGASMGPRTVVQGKNANDGKKRGMGMIAGVAAAAVMVAGAGIYFATRGGGADSAKHDVYLDLARDSLTSGNVDGAYSMFEKARLLGKDQPALQAKEKTFDLLLKTHTILNKGGSLDEVLNNLAEIRQALPKDDPLVEKYSKLFADKQNELRKLLKDEEQLLKVEDIDGAEKKIADAENLFAGTAEITNKRKEIDSFRVSSRQSDFRKKILAANKLRVENKFDDATKLLADAEGLDPKMFSKDPMLVKARGDLDKRHKMFDESNKAVETIEKGLLNPQLDEKALAELDKTLAEATSKFGTEQLPANAKFAELRTQIEGKQNLSKDQRESMSKIDAWFASNKDADNFDEIRTMVNEFAAKFKDSSAAANRLQTLKDAEALATKQRAALDEIGDLIKNQDAQNTELKLAEYEQNFGTARAAVLAAKRQQFAELKAQFDKMMKDATATIDSGANLQDAASLLANAKKMYPTSTQIAIQSGRIDKAHETFMNTLVEATDLIKKGVNLPDAEAKLAAAEKMFAKDANAAKARAALAGKRSDFEQLVESAQKTIAGRKGVDKAKDTLDSAAKMYPQDQKLKDALGQFDQAKKEFDATLADVKSKMKQELKPEEYDALDKKLVDADVIFPNTPDLKALRGDIEKKNKIGKERNDFIARVNALLQKDDLQSAATQIGQGETTYGKPFFENARKLLEEKQAFVAALKSIRTNLDQEALSDADKLIAQLEAKYADNTKVAAFRKEYTEKLKDVTDRTDKLSAINSLLDKDKAGSMTEADVTNVDTMISQAEKRWKTSKDVTDARTRYGPIAAKYEGIRKKNEFDALYKTLDAKTVTDQQLDRLKSLLPTEPRVDDLRKARQEYQAELIKKQHDASNSALAEAEALIDTDTRRARAKVQEARSFWPGNTRIDTVMSRIEAKERPPVVERPRPVDNPKPPPTNEKDGP